MNAKATKINETNWNVNLGDESIGSVKKLDKARGGRVFCAIMTTGRESRYSSLDLAVSYLENMYKWM